MAVRATIHYKTAKYKLALSVVYLILINYQPQSDKLQGLLWGNHADVGGRMAERGQPARRGQRRDGCRDAHYRREQRRF